MKLSPDNKLAVISASVVLGIAIVGLWQFLSVNKIIDPVFFGRPSSIAASLWHGLFGTLITVDAARTMVATLSGFVVASIAGVAFAFLLSQLPFLHRVVDPYMAGLNSLPRVALVPLFVVWLGIGLVAHAVMAASLTFFVVFANTITGVETLDPDLALLAKISGATRWQFFRKFVFPSAIPNIATGLELGFIFGMLGTVTGEMIAGQAGLGVRLAADAGNFRMSDYFATLFVLTAMTTIIARIIQLGKRWLLRWQAADQVSHRSIGN